MRAGGDFSESGYGCEPTLHTTPKSLSASSVQCCGRLSLGSRMRPNKAVQRTPPRGAADRRR
jgi:hypothetical protein